MNFVPPVAEPTPDYKGRHPVIKTRERGSALLPLYESNSEMAATS